MTSRLFSDPGIATQSVLPSWRPLPLPLDESLYLRASVRWRESREGLHEMLAATPSMRDTFDHLLKKKMDLDPNQAGLLFAATDAQPERFVSFTNACAFVLNHPTLETTVDQRCRVIGLNPAHPYSSLTPLQILNRLRTLDPQQAHAERWRAFWDARAPGTAMSRQDRAKQFYREHFEATVQLALAQKTLSAEQHNPLTLILDPPAGTLTLNGQPLHTEQLALVLKNGPRIKLTGAWVISTGDAASNPQWLYLPSLPVAIQHFKQRSDLEDWLSRQSLVPSGLPTDDLHYEYTAQSDPLTVGASELFAAHQQAQIAALRAGARNQTSLAEHGAQSLVQADQVDREGKNAFFFASPPELEDVHAPDDTDQASLFGSLYANVPWSLRQAALKNQRDALETRLEEVGENEGLNSIKQSMTALEVAEQAADEAASALLTLDRSQEPAEFQRQFTALYSAHKSGLHAEMALQSALKQLSDDECRMLKAVVDTPDDPDLAPVAASLTLSMIEPDAGKTTTPDQEFKGAWVVTQAKGLTDANSPHSVLLYWLGNGGGLQRFANLRELEHLVFKTHDRNSELTVQLKKITGDALLYSLNQLIQDFETQTSEVHQRPTEPEQAAHSAERLGALRKHALATLQVPVHAARSLVFSQLLEQNRSVTLAANLPGWLGALKEQGRSQLKVLIEAYILAMRQSHTLMTTALEPRDDFTRKHLHARLSKDFALKGHFDIQLSLPDTVAWEKRHTSGPSGPVQTSVMVAGARRSTMSLEALAQLNIDNVNPVQQDSLSQRLVFMRLEVTATDPAERIRLLNAITLPYLRKTLPDLDLPKAYEQLIRDAYLGAVGEPAFVRDHRRESLVEPWRLMLKLQGTCAHLQKQIGSNELKVLNIAIDASLPEAWRTDGRRVVLLPACLSVGGKDTPNEGPVGLAGVTFIEEQISGMTLLYLPDSPDGQFLRRYDSLESARMGLFNLCVNEKWISYLAGRALRGNVRAHERRIGQAVENYFNALISVGTQWPATTSLAVHLLDVHMGRLIEAHRDTSRSNSALYLERYALEGPRALNYMKMALGVLPFIGTAVALYDAWTATNSAVAAFLRGDVGDGLTELQSVLMSLIDAAMDLLPGEAIASSLSHTARNLTRARQLHRLAGNIAAMHEISQRQARHVVKRFAGYEYEKPLSLSGLQPATHGLYQGIYRHADGDFIERQGRLFQVELSKGSRNWRLSGNSRKTYKQPIALNENNQWDTWYGVFGTTFEGGGLGGGQALGRLADALDPIWPLAVRDRLPRWWVDRALRRQNALTGSADDIALQIDAKVKRTDAALAAYNATPGQRDANLAQAADAACLGDIELAKRHFQTLSELLPLTHGNKRRALLEFQSNGALLIADRHKQRLFIANHRVEPLMNRIDALTEKLDALPANLLAERLRVLEDVRKLRLEMLKEFDTIESLMRELNDWYQRISVRAQKAQLTQEVTMLNGRLSEANIHYLRTGNLLETVTRYDTTNDLSWFFLQNQARIRRAGVDRALFTQYSLPEVTATRAQRNQILQDCIEQYDQFRRAMNAWTASYPQHFHLDAVPPLLDGIEKMAERARKALDIPPQPAPAGTISKKVFTTENDQLLIGVEHWEPATQQRQYTVIGRDGFKEIWEPATNSRFRLKNPRQQPLTSARRDIDSLVAEARQKLNTQASYQAKVQSYAAQGMLPVDLEDMMLREANELTDRARNIEELAPHNPLVAQLREKAGELIASGRAMRTQQTLRTKKPTDGMLDDLVRHNAVEIRKSGPIKNLGKRRDGRVDYMQEYEIWNLTQKPSEVLWYAHFHYSRAAPAFGTFEKAHLKLPEHRYLTHADNADLPYADIGKRSAALPHFENL